MTDNSTLNAIVEVLEDKKACDINVIDVREKTSLADYFVVCHATSPTHSSTLVTSLEKASREQKMQLLRSDKSSSKEWKVLDYGDIIVHVFLEESRYYYDIEQVWKSDDPISVLQSRQDLRTERKPIDVKSLFSKAMSGNSRKNR